jgi:group II intron reverse transcriptase/maturase
MSHDPGHRYEWNTIPWRKLEARVFKLQRRIYQATTRGETQKARRLQKLLAASWSAKSLAVRRVTQENTGKKTAGVDGVQSLTPPQRLRLISAMDLHAPAKPVRRIWIPKPGKLEERPLGIPTWSDKLVQEVIRQILEAYYEPQFSKHAHGFRSKRGCHTALTEVEKTWTGTKWFIEGDIKGCYDSIDHTILIKILRANIYDNRFLRLIEGALKAGYCEEWTFHPSLSGSPQGGIVSPILSNIYMDQLDKFVYHTLIPEYTRGRQRQPNRTYKALQSLVLYYRKTGRREGAEALRKTMQQHPSVDPNDAEYSRLRYVRYADDFLLGYAGTRAEAMEIKEKIAAFLGTQLHLTLSAEKTLITHASTGRARFLGYEIGTMHSQTKFDKAQRRIIIGQIGLYIPEDVLEQKRKRYLRDGKAYHRAELMNQSEYDIIVRYQWEYRGLAAYYTLAQNLHRLGYLCWTMETSLLKTLAGKGRTTLVKTLKRLKSTTQTPNGPRKCLKLTIPRAGKRPLVAMFGGISLQRKHPALKEQVLKDQVLLPHVRRRSEIVERLLKDTCEVCESKDHIQMHHVRHLADLNKQGRREKPLWMQIMMARKRKSIPLCRRCHMDVHHNRPKFRKQGN